MLNKIITLTLGLTVLCCALYAGSGLATITGTLISVDTKAMSMKFTGSDNKEKDLRVKMDARITRNGKLVSLKGLVGGDPLVIKIAKVKGKPYAAIVIAGKISKKAKARIRARAKAKAKAKAKRAAAKAKSTPVPTPRTVIESKPATEDAKVEEAAVETAEEATAETATAAAAETAEEATAETATEATAETATEAAVETSEEAVPETEK